MPDPSEDLIEDKKDTIISKNLESMKFFDNIKKAFEEAFVELILMQLRKIKLKPEYITKVKRLAKTFVTQKYMYHAAFNNDLPQVFMSCVVIDDKLNFTFRPASHMNLGSPQKFKTSPKNTTMLLNVYDFIILDKNKFFEIDGRPKKMRQAMAKNPVVSNALANLFEK